MTNTITELCDAVRQFQGQDIYLSSDVHEFCPNRTNCRYVSFGDKKCLGHLFSAGERVVHVNFCDLRSDRLVIHYSPFVELKSMPGCAPKGRLDRQRQLHILKSQGFWLWSGEDRVSLNFTSDRLQVIELVRPHWW